MEKDAICVCIRNRKNESLPFGPREYYAEWSQKKTNTIYVKSKKTKTETDPYREQADDFQRVGGQDENGKEKRKKTNWWRAWILNISRTQNSIKAYTKMFLRMAKWKAGPILKELIHCWCNVKRHSHFGKQSSNSLNIRYDPAIPRVKKGLYTNGHSSPKLKTIRLNKCKLEQSSTKRNGWHMQPGNSPSN